MSSVSSTTTTSIVGGVIISVTVSTGRAELERYIRDNRVAVMHDVTRGSGPVIEDLAHLFGVAEVARLGMALREHRDDLLALSAHVDAARAAQFAELVEAAIQRAGLAP